MDEELTTGDGFADVVLDYSPAGNAPDDALDEPYGTLIGDFGGPTEVTTDVVLGNSELTALSLPTDSSITVGFTDEIIIDNPGNDIFIPEVGAAGDRGEVFVSSSSNPGEQDFVRLGIGNGGTTSEFDLADIDFTEPVRAIRIVGLNNNGILPGFDVVSVQGLPESIDSVDAAPIISTRNRTEVAEGETDVIDINATDNNDEEGDGLTFSITGGANRNLFTVNSDNGQLAFREAPTIDPEGENSFRVQVTVTDSDDLTAVQNLRVNLANEDEPRNLATPNLVTEPLNTVTELTGDRLRGTAGRDLILGTADPDILEGLRNNDVLQGDAGDDQLDGGQGNDTAVYQDDEGGAIINLATDTATDGFGDTDTLTSIENIIGSGSGDRLTGNDQANNLTGGGGNDTISGGQGNDYLTGLGGADVLTGDAGVDNFTYVTPGEGRDRIENFEVDSDTILIVGNTFSGDLSTGTLNESRFILGSEATTSEQRFIFNDDNGQLLYDQDGNGNADSQILATFTAIPDFTASNISIV